LKEEGRSFDKLRTNGVYLLALILGLDPSLSSTGWGIIRAEGARISHIANGQIKTDPAAPMAERLAALQAGLAAVIAAHRPARAAAEEIFVNKNPQSTLKLAQARGAVLAACGAAGLAVNEHAARLVKKAVTGTGGAEKAQVAAMVKVLLPGIAVAGSDAADALAVAIADAHLAPRS
jgi:crossover junction endodeoxyribonuclease RuvC